MGCKSIQSSSSSRMIWKHDVFVSFRGEDTRNNFADHLFAALQRKGIVTFRDDAQLKKGEPISPELLQAIEGSQIFIIVLSKNYAASTWCLQELEKIVDCIKLSGQSVLPIFYDVDPSEVRKQSGNYGKAFAEHEERFKEDLEMVQRWRGALTQVANLSGWDVRNKPQYEEIKKLVKEVARILVHKVSILVDDLVGMHSRVEQLEKLLDLGSDDDVRVVGIWGMGGIGKTTLATVLYDKISHQYDACCFIDDVSNIYRNYGPKGLQKQLLCQTRNEENLEIYNLTKATYLIRTMLHDVRALIVLDNVDQVEQLEKLALNREWLRAGSRIIIISRNEHILREYGVDELYSVQLLSRDNALQLFCRKAFKCDDITRGYEELTYLAIKYAEGLPLAIKVLGSFLFGRDVSEWRSALTRLRENPRREIMDVLRISFDGLEEMEKEIFLHIACFFYNNGEGRVIRILDYCGLHSVIGIRVLVDKSLITISKRWIYMHDLLKKLGRSIVREKSPTEPGKWSRLWRYKDIHNVLLEKTATENIEALFSTRKTDEYTRKTTLRVDALSKMSRLRLLELWNVNFSGSLLCLSNELRYLSWYKYPFTCLPSCFQPDKLVELSLMDSNIKQLWEGVKPLPNLRIMDLAWSENLIKTPDFSGIPNLDQLNLGGCIKLVRIHPSIGLLRKLAFLNLKNCKNLVSIPNKIFGLSSLEVLNLSGCSKLLNNQLFEKPRHAELLKKLDINEAAIQCQLTSSICKRLVLPFRSFYSKRRGDPIAILLPSFPCLRDLNLSFCNLLQIPDAIGWLHFLRRLNLGGNNFVSLPSMKELSQLIHLNLEHCTQLKYLPELPSSTVLPAREELFCDDYHAALYIFNCSRLADMERCRIMAFSWMIQVLLVHREFFLPRGLIDIVIPGTQIPKWFTNQSVGGSISIDPSPIVQDNDCIGVAVCATFVAQYDADNISRELTSSICYCFESLNGSWADSICIRIEKDLIRVDSEHLCVVYFTREEFNRIISWVTEDVHSVDYIKFECYSGQGLHVEVKKCGLRWVYKQDLEELNQTMTHSGNSSIQICDGLGIGGAILSLEAGNWSQ